MHCNKVGSLSQSWSLCPTSYCMTSWRQMQGRYAGVYSFHKICFLFFLFLSPEGKNSFIENIHAHAAPEARLRNNKHKIDENVDIVFYYISPFRLFFSFLRKSENFFYKHILTTIPCDFLIQNTTAATAKQIDR